MKKFLIFFIFIQSKLLYSQDPVIVISAGKTFQALNTVGSSVEVIDTKNIEDSNNFLLSDVIEESATSINSFKTGGYGSSTGIQLRGLEKRYSTVYVDGVKMMDPSSSDGSFYLENILSSGIEKVEILKGTQSSLYGGNAIGGVINIFTKKAGKEDRSTLAIEKGSNNTNDIQYSINKNFENLNFYFGLNKFFTDGISAMNDNTESDKYRNNNLVSNLQFELNKNLILENSTRIANTYSAYDEVLSSRTDINNSTKNLELSNSFKLIHQSKKFKNTLMYNKLLIERYTTGYDLSKTNYFGYRDSLNYLGEFSFNLDNKIIFGIDTDFEAARYRVDFGESDKEHDESILSEYFDYQSRILENLYFTFGLRNDDHTTAGAKKSGRTSFAYLLNNNEKITSSFGAGVRFPSLYDYAYGYETIVDKGGSLEELQSERGLSFDLGYNKFFSDLNLNLSTTYFKTLQKNPILNNARTEWVQRNATGRNQSEGIELSASLLPPNKKFSYDLNYTFTDSYDANTCDQDELDSYSDNECRLTNNALAKAKVRVPRHAINSKISYFHAENIKSSLKAKYRSSMRDFGNQNNNWTDVILKERLVLDYIFNMKFKDSLNFNFTINNLLDKKYEEVYQYSSPSRSLFFRIKSIR